MHVHVDVHVHVLVCVRVVGGGQQWLARVKGSAQREASGKR